MTKYFITFGGGGQNYIDAGNRLILQMKQLNLFDKYYLYTDTFLKNDKDFWDKHKSFMTNPKNRIGFGNWLWKPYIIKRTMDKLEDGDILLYLDAGCEINMTKKMKMMECLEIVKEDLIIGSYSKTEKERCKMDLLLRLRVLDKNILNSKQRQGGTNLFCVCPKTRTLVNQWYSLAQEQNYHFLDDSPSRARNLSCYEEHRHDQSIFSLLTKIHKIFSNRCDLRDAIFVARNKTSIPRH